MEPDNSAVDVTAPAYLSFVVRLWKGELSDWHSEVEHIQSGAHWRFHTLDDTLAFLRRHVEASDYPNPIPPE